MSSRPAPDTLIRSKDNPRIKQLRRLRTRAERAATGTVFVEGVRFVARAAQCRAPIETLVVAPKVLEDPFGRSLAAGLGRAGVPVLAVSPDVFYSLSWAEEPQGLAAVVRQRWFTLDQLPAGLAPCWLALDGVRNTGNLGTMLRTCEAAGAGGVILMGETCDPYDPATVRATMGSLFAVRLARATPAELRAWATRHGCTVVGTSPSAQLNFTEARYPAPVVLLLGDERTGLSRAGAAICDESVRIPMQGRCDSLNVAVAAGVLLYHVAGATGLISDDG